LGFCLSHPQALLPILLVAAVLGYLRAASGSLFPALGAHIAFNAVEISSMTLKKRIEWEGSEVAMASAGLVVLLVVFQGLVWKHPLSRQSRFRDGEGLSFAPVPGEDKDS
jgi:membrane protease YdiL (CAAX protease family)